MPPNLALSFGVVLILVLVGIEMRRKLGISFAIFIPLSWYILTASGGFAYWWSHYSFDFVGMSDLEGNPTDRAIYSGLIIVGILVIAGRRVDWTKIVRGNIWLILFFLYMLISASWSDFPWLSLRRWVRAMGGVVMALVILTGTNPLAEVGRLLRIAFIIHLPLSIIIIKYFPSIGIVYEYWTGFAMWAGITQGKNILGQIATTCGIFSVWNLMRKWKGKNVILDLALLAMALWLLKGSRDSASITAAYAFFFGIFLLFGLHHFRKNTSNVGRRIGVIAILLVICFLIVRMVGEGFWGGSVVDEVLKSSRRNVTLTDRTLIWGDLLEIAKQNAIAGVGYGAFWVGNPERNLWEKHGYGLGQAHNGYLDVYLELGLVGVFLLAVMLFAAYKNIMEMFEREFEYARFRMVFLSTVLLINVTESTLLRGSHNLWFIFLLVAVNKMSNDESYFGGEMVKPKPQEGLWG